MVEIKSGSERGDHIRHIRRFSAYKKKNICRLSAGSAETQPKRIQKAKKEFFVIEISPGNVPNGRRRTHPHKCSNAAHLAVSVPHYTNTTERERGVSNRVSENLKGRLRVIRGKCFKNPSVTVLVDT